MWRHVSRPRDGWLEKVTEQGLVFAETPSPDGSSKTPYWNESAWYEFTMDEVLRMESATEELYGMCLEAVEVMLSGRFSDQDLALPAGALAYARESWKRKDPSCYARFDLRFEGGDPQMYEINGDTPTGLVESGVIQWRWLEDLLPDLDQWNSVHDRLVKWWGDQTKRGLFPSGKVHFYHGGVDTSGEEEMTVAYMQDCASQAGMVHQTHRLKTYNDAMGRMGWHEEMRRFVDWGDKPIETVFKLYPWEDMLRESFGKYLLDKSEAGPVRWVEPAWKLALSTKAILPLLWEMHPGHKNLLPAYFGHPHDLEEWVSKPLQGREGDNITIHTKDAPERVLDGHYGDQPVVYQAWAPPPSFDGNHAVIGSWIIDGQSAGAIVRESDAEVTDYFSRVVPHVITDGLAPTRAQIERWLIER